MKTSFGILLASIAIGLSAHAELLPPSQADSICHTKALRAAHFLSESNRKFVVTYTIAKYAEISTPVTYEYRYEDQVFTDALFTVVAYAYPDDRRCTLGSITNNFAGND